MNVIKKRWACVCAPKKCCLAQANNLNSELQYSTEKKDSLANTKILIIIMKTVVKVFFTDRRPHLFLYFTTTLYFFYFFHRKCKRILAQSIPNDFHVIFVYIYQISAELETKCLHFLIDLFFFLLNYTIQTGRMLISNGIWRFRMHKWV